ncbi:uncharacterized protein LOC129681946 [Psammomys obesus]|uniref:uncharacterized protein LOC129681946 n=1 Tax=Psammomys obesus TaxID=48139 RepID=UPI0024531F6F|nr:uncharacterized protein LOC129681946 [Psammomys obesus]
MTPKHQPSHASYPVCIEVALEPVKSRTDSSFRRRGVNADTHKPGDLQRVPETGASALAGARVSPRPRPARCHCVQAARPGAGHRGKLCWCALGGWRAPGGWRAGPVIWGSTSRHLCSWRGPVLQRQPEGRPPGGGAGVDKGRGEVGWDGNKANSRAGSQKEGVSVIAGRRLPPALPASLLRHPPLPPHCSPSPSRVNATAAARVRAGPVVTVRQRGLSGSWPPQPAAAVALPGPCAPLTPRPSQAPYGRSFLGAIQGKTPSKRKQTPRGGGQANGAQWTPRTSFLGAFFHPRNGTRVGHPELLLPSLSCLQGTWGMELTTPRPQALRPQALTPQYWPPPARCASPDYLLQPPRSARVPAAGAL